MTAGAEREAGVSGRRGTSAPRLSPARAALALLGLLLAAFAVLLAGRLAAERAVADLSERARSALTLASAGLSGELERQSVLSGTLVRDAELSDLLSRPDRAAAARLDAKLASLAEEAGASVVYLLDVRGITLAASNAATPVSFVGSDYSFRRYFREAMAKGSALQYALGTVSGRPGFYLTRRIDGPSGPLGVLVAKIELARLEARWQDAGYIVFLADDRGVVLATSRPEWRFGTMAPLPEAERAAIRRDLQDETAPLRPLPLAHEGGLALTGPERAQRHVEALARVEGLPEGWRLHLLVPAGAALVSAQTTARAGAFFALLALVLAVALWLRRRRAIRQREEGLAAMNAELEARVADRTRALKRSNTALEAEMAERAEAETRVQRLRDELAQANRLSILGQVSAGVAHEINQPVAAIRTYAENGARFLELGRPEKVEATLGTIVGLTERVAAITETLKRFSRRAAGPVEAIALAEAFEGARSLLAARLSASGAAVEWPGGEAASLAVSASRIRLEQILVNLVQNALDALAGRPDGRIAIASRAEGERVVLTVSDNGPGIDPAIRQSLFMPFTTSKEKGLGLGLVICGEIARELGGSLTLADSSPAGTAFRLELRRAP